MIPKLLLPLYLLLSSNPLPEPHLSHPVTIPTQFTENMFYACPVTKDGVELKFYTDSGGGIIIYRNLVDRLHLTSVKQQGNGQQWEEVSLPEFQPTKTIPPPLGHHSRLVVLPEDQKMSILGLDTSGLLGQEWFAAHVWTWDYPGHKLLWRSNDDLPKVAPAHRLSLGFPTDQQGQRYPNLNFPRIQATIDGELIDLLFDTGANTVLTDAAIKAIHDAHPAHRATSFINQSIFDRWHTKHPEWKVVEKAEEGTAASMIEVPKVTVAGYEVGSVWFTARPDKNFDEWMSQWMDKKVHGALGGSALQYFRVTIDYPSAIAYFERP